MPKDETGIAAFTLAEVLISALLMLLSLTLLLSAFVGSRRSLVLSQARLGALQIACDEAERLRTNAYTSISNWPTYAAVTNTFIAYQMSRAVTNCSTKTNILDAYRNITITIRWMDPASKRSQALTNYVTLFNTN